MNALAWHPGTHRARVLAVALVAVVSVLVGLLVAAQPLLAVVPVAGVVLVALVESARARFAFVVFGGLLTLQGSEGLDARKLAYMAGCALCVAISLTRRSQPLTGIQRQVIAPLERSSLVWFAVIAVSFPVAMYGSGASASAWARDALPYVLFAVVPLFLRDIAIEEDARGIRALFVLAGLLTAASVSMTWIARRGLADVPLDRLVFPTVLLPAALYAFALGRAISGPQRVRYACLAGLIVALLLTTGTRTNLILLIGPLLIAVATRGNVWQRMARSMSTTVLVGIFLTVSLAFVFALTSVQASDVTGRLSQLSGLRDRSTVAGQSYDERARQTDEAMKAFRSQPLTGLGPGRRYAWTTVSGGRRLSFNLDSPASVLAKFGLLGAAATAFSAVCYLRSIRALRPHVSPDLAAALPTYAVIVGLVALILPVMEDKGLSFGLLMLFAVALHRVH